MGIFFRGRFMIKKAKSKLDLKIGESNTGRDSRDTRMVYLY
jgi:hypothetical protein